MKIIKDLKVYVGNDGIGKVIATIVFNPCFHSECLFRLSNLFYRLHLSVISKIIWYINRLLFHVDIDYRADLAGGFMLVHGLGTVIGKDVVSEGKLVVFQGVTIGGGSKRPARIDEKGNHYAMPLFKKNVIVYANSTVIGAITIEENSIIKANSLVY